MSTSRIVAGLRSPAVMFIVATAMSTTVATLLAMSVASSSASSNAAAPPATCSCSCQETPAVVETLPRPAVSSTEADAPADVVETQSAEPESHPDAAPSKARRPSAKVAGSSAKIKGSIDKDIIRRIVKAHINEVRHCYNQGLVRNPNLEGRVAVQFTIGPTGKVPVAVVQDSNLPDRGVSQCIAKAVKRWKFPKPQDGSNTVVSYPFVLSPG